MSDELKHADPFKPQEPSIPGVTDSAARAKQMADQARAAAASAKKPINIPPILTAPGFWIAIVAAILVFSGVAFGIRWWNTARASRASESAAETSAVAPVVDLAPPAPAGENLPFGPGPVATVAALSKTWSSQRFTFRGEQSTDNIPGIVVKLPNGIYWGVSLREPFGTCQMDYVTDLNKLDTIYHYAGDHPVIADPCTHAVYDLTKYGPGPNGMVRGEIVGGSGVRPPVAIEMAVRGKEVVAVKVEE